MSNALTSFIAKRLDTTKMSRLFWLGIVLLAASCILVNVTEISIIDRLPYIIMLQVLGWCDISLYWGWVLRSESVAGSDQPTTTINPSIMADMLRKQSVDLEGPQIHELTSNLALLNRPGYLDYLMVFLRDSPSLIKQQVLLHNNYLCLIQTTECESTDMPSDVIHGSHGHRTSNVYDLNNMLLHALDHYCDDWFAAKIHRAVQEISPNLFRGGEFQKMRERDPNVRSMALFTATDPVDGPNPGIRSLLIVAGDEGSSLEPDWSRIIIVTLIDLDYRTLEEQEEVYKWVISLPTPVAVQ